MKTKKIKITGVFLPLIMLIAAVGAFGIMASTDDGDCATSITCSVCGDVTTEGNSAEGNSNEGNAENGEPEKNNPLGAGAIIGISVGSAAVVGLGGFSLFWFVIKKKSWADLLNIFKK